MKNVGVSQRQSLMRNLLYVFAGLCPAKTQQFLIFNCLFPRFFNRFFYRADHVKRLFRQVVVFSFYDLFKAFNRIFGFNVTAFKARKRFGNKHRLR